MTEARTETENIPPCRVEGCRKTRPLHHAFRKFTDKQMKKVAWDARRPVEEFGNICAACREHRKDHILHPFEPGLAPVDPSVRVSCSAKSCGAVLRVTENLTTLEALRGAAYTSGWRLMGKTSQDSAWACPKHVASRDARFRKSIDPRQAMFVALDEPERRDPG